jgi:phosphonate transport system substrate-binding protein
MLRRKLIKQGLLSLTCVANLPQAIASSSSSKRSFNVGVLPHLTSRTMVTQYEPLRVFLSQTQASQITVSTAADWKSFYENAKSGKYDLIVTAAHMARLMQSELGLQPIASFHPNLKGVFITAKSKKARSPEFAKSKLIATANRASLIDLEGERWLEKIHHMKRNEDYGCLHVRGGDSVTLSVLNGESAAGILCLSELEGQSDAIKSQIEVISTFAEVPNFIAMSGHATVTAIATAERALLEKQLIAFSESNPLGKNFEQRTGFKFGQHPLEQRMQAMDIYAEKLHRLLHI